MKKKTITTLAIIALLFCGAEVKGQSNKMTAFETLIGGQWVFEGIQLGGQQGKTIHEFAWGLDGKLVKSKHFNTDIKTGEFGLRNEGIRAYNEATRSFEFYEFDKLGGITKGQISVEGKNLHYDYEYHGTKLRDSWRYVDDNSYELIVGTWKDGKWETQFHKAIFTRRR